MQFRVTTVSRCTSFILVTAGAVTCYVLGQSGTQPACHVDDSFIDFGRVSTGDVMVYETEVRNAGHRELVIDSVLTGCGCIEAQLDGSCVRPGESVGLELAIRPATLGLQSSVVILKTNDPRTPNYPIRTTCEVVGDTGRRCLDVDFGDIRSDALPCYQTEMIKGIAYRRRGRNLVILDYPKFMACRLSPVPKTANTRVSLRLLRDSPLGVLYIPMRVGYQGGNQYCEFIVRGNVRGRCFARPAAIDFGRISNGGEGFSANVTVQSRKPNLELLVERTRLTDDIAEPGLIQVEVGLNRRQQNVRVSIDPTRNRGLWTPSRQVGALLIDCKIGTADAVTVAVPIRYTSVTDKARL